MADNTPKKHDPKPLSDLPPTQPHEEKVKGGEVDSNRLLKEQLRNAQAQVESMKADL